MSLGPFFYIFFWLLSYYENRVNSLQVHGLENIIYPISIQDVILSLHNRLAVDHVLSPYLVKTPLTSPRPELRLNVARDGIYLESWSGVYQGEQRA